MADYLGKQDRCHYATDGQEYHRGSAASVFWIPPDPNPIVGHKRPQVDSHDGDTDHDGQTCPAHPRQYATLKVGSPFQCVGSGNSPVFIGQFDNHVVGVGMIGLLVVQALRAAGCHMIVAIDLDQAKLDLARELGADYGFLPDQCDVANEVRNLTDGRGSDAAFEVVGATSSIMTAADCLRKGGTLTLVGNISPVVELPLQTVVTREITLKGSYASAGEYPDCLDMITEGKVNVDPLISAVVPLSEGADWFERLYRKEAGLMKVILKP